MPRLEHIGIAVSDLNDALQVWRDVLGSEPYKAETVDKDGIRTIFLDGGTAKIELLEALGPDSAISGYLEKRGSGLHHLAFEVTDLGSALNRLREVGYEPVDSDARPGADGKMIAFLHPRQTAGVLIELCESRGSALKARDILVGDRSVRVREAGRPGNRPLVMLGFAGLAAVVSRKLEPFCYVVAIDDVGVSPADLLNAIGAKKAHIAASASFIGPALETASSGTALSLSLFWRGAAMAGSSRPVCPVLILAPDANEDIREALKMRSLLGGDLAVLPESQDDVLAEVIERHVMRASGTDFFAEE